MGRETQGPDVIRAGRRNAISASRKQAVVRRIFAPSDPRNPRNPRKIRAPQGVAPWTGSPPAAAAADALGLPCEGVSPRRCKRLYSDPARHCFQPFGRGGLSDETERSVTVAVARARRQAKFLLVAPLRGPSRVPPPY
jgi:hypothetical protein